MSIVKSMAVGEGDMFYIKHGSDNFTIIDCCMNDGEEDSIIDELKEAKHGKTITRFISTHPDDDHIRGLKYLDEKLDLLNFYCVKNSATKPDQSDDFDHYCQLRDSKKAFYVYKECSRKWMNVKDEERGSSGVNILWPDVNNDYFKSALDTAAKGGDPNNICPIIKYSLDDGVTILWMGDLKTEFMNNIEKSITLPKVNILFAPHHGRESGKVPKSWMDVLKPEIVILGEAPSEHLDYYKGYNTITQNSAKAITMECETSWVHIYVSNENYSVNFLKNLQKSNTYGKYLGSLSV